MHEERSLLGPCCICEGTRDVSTIVLLNAKSPMRHRGWGCYDCGIPAHGAIAVLCDPCVNAHQPHVEDALRFACRGRPMEDGRLPIADLRGEHGHVWSQHPEATQVPPLTVASADRRWPTHVEEGQGCHCSRCGETIWEGVIAMRVFPESGRYQYRYHPTCFGALPDQEDPYSAETWSLGLDMDTP